MQSFIYVLGHIYMYNDTYGVSMGKKTTTLTLDEETVKRAKKMNINISEITETVLKGFTFELSDLDEKIIKEKYNELFAAIIPILKRQGICIRVGYVFEENTIVDDAGEEQLERIPIGDVFLQSDGTFYLEPFGRILKDILNHEDIQPLTPKEILSNLINVIDEHKERIKNEIKEIEMVKRIVEALYPTFAKK